VLDSARSCSATAAQRRRMTCESRVRARCNKTTRGSAKRDHL